MPRQQHSWSLQEKQRLYFVVKKYKQNDRINWNLVAEQMPDRTPTQCRLQYRNNNQNKQKVNNQWNTYMTRQLMCLTHVYGKKWNFLQKNYFPNITSEQLRLKSFQQEQKHKQYSEITLKAENGQTQMCDKEIQFLKTAYQEIKAIRIRFEQVKVNELGIVQLEPLYLVFFNILSKNNFIAEEEKRLQRILQKLDNKSSVSASSISFQ
ncbi:Myb-like_DNA-binding domain-containing protein [Hexamita inflata]|uniref:Myb-like_DNA-binding domain-containing protein n=1 Tax=Hexamita inflata TaxID=28002 RepID=A0ABP1HMI9_9EUKA